MSLREPSVCDCGEHGFVGLTRGFVALFDPDDIGLISCASWYAASGKCKVYARADAVSLPDKSMHRAILCPPPDRMVDHKNGDSLDNRRRNLRECTPSENSMNARQRRTGRTGLKGVFVTEKGRFRASVTASRRRVYLGLFDCPIQAALAYDAAAIAAHGEFARTNASLGLLPPSLTASRGQPPVRGEA